MPFLNSNIDVEKKILMHFKEVNEKYGTKITSRKMIKRFAIKEGIYLSHRIMKRLLDFYVKNGICEYYFDKTYKKLENEIYKFDTDKIDKYLKELETAMVETV